MRSLLFATAVFLTLPAAGVAAPGNKKAAKKIWKVSKKWLYDARATGSTGKGQSVKVKLELTGKTTGKVATYKASFAFPSGGKKCRVKVTGALEKGSYEMKKRPLLKGTIGFQKISSSCALPDYLKKKIRSLSLPLSMGLVGKKLCVSVGDRKSVV